MKLLFVLSKFRQSKNKQLSSYFENILSKFQCDFRELCGPHHLLWLLVEKLKDAVVEHKIFGALLKIITLMVFSYPC